MRVAVLSVAAGARDYAFASCEAGEVATGGGFYWDAQPSSDMYIQDQGGTTAAGTVLTSPGVAVGWGVEAFNGSGGVQAGKVQVLCAETGAATPLRGGDASSSDGR